MASTGYDYGVRSGLNQKGISNDRITYNKQNGVMIDNQPFMQPDKVYQGTSFTSQGNFNNAWDAYNKANQKPVGSATGGHGASGMNTYNANPVNTGYDPYANVKQNPYTNQTDRIIQQLLNYSQNQQPFDPYSSSQYQAAQAQANRAAQQNTRAAQEAYGSAGFGRSSAMGERIAGVQNDATEYLMTQILPQIEAQEQARRQQEFNNIMSALNPLMSQQGRADNLVQQDFENLITEGQLTGNYKGERTLGGTQADLANKQSNWNAYMDMVNQTGNLGTGPKNTWQNLVSSAYGGDPTNSAKQQEFNQGITMAQLTGILPDGTPTSDEQQRQLSNLWTVAQQTGTIPNEIADLYGIQRGTRTQDAIAQAEQIAISRMNANTSRQNANTSAYSANTSRMNANTSRLMDIWQATGVAPEGISGVAPGTPYGSDLDRAYRQAQVDQIGAKADTVKPSKNDLEAEYYTNVDRMRSQGIDLKSFFRNEKENIIRDLGKSGYDALKQSYGIYD